MCVCWLCFSVSVCLRVMFVCVFSSSSTTTSPSISMSVVPVFVSLCLSALRDARRRSASFGIMTSVKALEPRGTSSVTIYRHTSYIIHHTSFINTSYIIHHHTSYIIHHTSFINTSYIIHHTPSSYMLLCLSPHALHHQMKFVFVRWCVLKCSFAIVFVWKRVFACYAVVFVCTYVHVR